MNAETVHALAEHLAAIDDDWRKANGYTGRAVHKRAYWRNMAARILAESVNALAEKKRSHPVKESERP
jgi:hypothetical protein